MIVTIEYVPTYTQTTATYIHIQTLSLTFLHLILHNTIQDMKQVSMFFWTVNLSASVFLVQIYVPPTIFNHHLFWRHVKWRYTPKYILPVYKEPKHPQNNTYKVKLNFYSFYS